jgi:hypothetical protein
MTRQSAHSPDKDRGRGTHLKPRLSLPPVTLGGRSKTGRASSSGATDPGLTVSGIELRARVSGLGWRSISAPACAKVAPWGEVGFDPDWRRANEALLIGLYVELEPSRCCEIGTILSDGHAGQCWSCTAS